MNDYEKIDWISFAIQEAMNGNLGELSRALELVEMLRENHEHLKFEDNFIGAALASQVNTHKARQKAAHRRLADVAGQ